jgi:hypothetical protein
MRSIALERLESLLESRKLDRTLTHHSTGPWSQEPLTISTGVEALDRSLGGGWRQGEISEIVGPRSSGRTSLLVATLAVATGRDGIVGLVDAFDRFDPVTASHAGLDLDRLLWVRGARLTLELMHPDRPPAAGYRPPRAAADFRQQPVGCRRPPADTRSHLKAAGLAPRDDIDRALRHAIRALDLIVRAGGFAVAALDLADLPPSHLRGLPFTTWMRLAYANEGRETVCLLVGDAAMGKSARGVSVCLETGKRWMGTSPQSRRFAGFDVRAQVVSARTFGEGHPRWVLGH